METLEDEQPDDDAKISYPEEIIEQIISRLPIKSLLRFKSVSKPWLSLISTPSFTKLHSTLGPSTTSLFLTLVDSSTNTRYFFSGANTDNGSVANLIKLDNTPYVFGAVEHLNGLVCLIDRDYHSDKIYASVINPSTHKFFKLPAPCTHHTHRKGRIYHLFGFDESRNEHKVLMIRRLIDESRFEIMIFSMSTYSWRNINDAEPPIGFTWDRLHFYGASVCVNSVIHLLVSDSLSDMFHILAFDLRTHMFSVINTPRVVSDYFLDTFILKINGCLAFLFYYCERVVETNEMNIWILQDYENRVWVEEIITFPEPWVDLGCPLPKDSINMDEIIFCSSKANEDARSFVYDKKSRCFKSLQFTLGHQFPVSTTLWFSLIRSYVESMVPL